MKHWESSKVTHIATASMNNICVRYAKEREGKSKAIQAALNTLRKAQQVKVTSLAWKNDEYRPEGIQFKVGNTFKSRDDEAHPTILSRQRSKRSIDEVKQNSDFTEEKARLISDAKNEVNRLLQQESAVPVTRIQWATWLDNNICEFRERMKTAHIERRKHNRPLAGN